MNMNIVRCAALSLLFTISVTSQDIEAASYYPNGDLAMNNTAVPYSITNLGTSESFSTDSDGNRVVVASDGTRYSFPGSTPQTWTPASPSQAGVPIPSQYPSQNTIEGGFYPYGGLSNANGTFVVAANYYSPTRTINDSDSVLYTFNRKSDGSFGPATVFETVFQYVTTNSSIRPLLFNNNNLLLASLGNTWGSSGWQLFDLRNDQSWELYHSMGGYWMNNPVAMDDQGRILMTGSVNGPDPGPTSYFLLTPDGMTSNPIPAPEPTALVTLGSVSIGLLIRRRFRERVSR